MKFLNNCTKQHINQSWFDWHRYVHSILILFERYNDYTCYFLLRCSCIEKLSCESFCPINLESGKTCVDQITSKENNNTIFCSFLDIQESFCPTYYVLGLVTCCASRLLLFCTNARYILHRMKSFHAGLEQITL